MSFVDSRVIRARMDRKDRRINRQATLRACTGANGGGTIPEGKKAGNDADLPPGRANGLATEQELTLPMTTVPNPTTPDPGCTVNTVAPKRIQRRRTKGWRMPEGAIYVGRPTLWGNPWTPNGYWDAGYSGSQRVALDACIENFRAWMTRTRSSWTGDVPTGPIKAPGRPMVYHEPPDVSPLRGKDLACWCPLDQPCHADVLLELANAPVNAEATR
jgi:hypothetical protein